MTTCVQVNSCIQNKSPTNIDAEPFAHPTVRSSSEIALQSVQKASDIAILLLPHEPISIAAKSHCLASSKTWRPALQENLTSFAHETIHAILTLTRHVLAECVTHIKTNGTGMLGSIKWLLDMSLTFVKSIQDFTPSRSVQLKELIQIFEQNGTLTKKQMFAFDMSGTDETNVYEKQLQTLLQLLGIHREAGTTQPKDVLISHFLHVFHEKPILQHIFSQSEKNLFLQLSHSNNVSFNKETLFSLLRKASIFEWACHNIALSNVECHEDIQIQICQALARDNLKDLALALSAAIDPEALAQASLAHQTYLHEIKTFLSSKTSLQTLSKFIEQDRELSLALDDTRKLKHFIKQLTIALQEQDSTSVQTQIKQLEALFTSFKRIHFEKLVDTHFGTSNEWTHQAALVGTLKRTYMRAVSYFQELIKKAPHQKLTRVSSLYCSHGGGHKSLTDATAPYLEAPERPSIDQRFVVQPIDLPKAVRAHLDPIYKLTSQFGFKDKDAPWLFNWLLVNDYCNIYMFLKGLGLKKGSEEELQAAKQVIQRALLQTGSDLIQMNYTFDNGYIDPATNELGIPYAHVCSDLDNTGWPFTPSNHHFRLMSQSKENPLIQKSIEPNIPEAQVLSIGLPVGKDFDVIPSSEVLAQYRRDVLHLTDDRPVVVFTNGANGTISPLPELLATQYHDAKQPIAIVIACGRNENLKKHMDSHVKTLASKNPNIQFITLGNQPHEAMAKLFRSASCVVGKPGGLTTMECLKAGTRFIADNTKPRFPWEKFNSEVVEQCGRGSHIEKNEQLVDTVCREITLAKTAAAPQSLTEMNAGLKIYEGMKDLVSEVERDSEFQERKKSWFRFAKRFAAEQVV